MRLSLITTVWRRPEVTRFVLGYYAGLVVDGIEWERFAVCSEGERFPGWMTVEHGNENLWTKWNAGWQAAVALDPDGILIVGSDDLVASSHFQRIRDERPRFAHLKSIYLHHVPTGRTAFFEEGNTGVGTYISREVYPQYPSPWTVPMRGQMIGKRMGPRNHLRRGLDGPLKRMRTRDSLVLDSKAVDLKSRQNLWSFDVLLQDKRCREATEAETQALWADLGVHPDQMEAA